MKIRNRLFILIMIIAIASAQWVPAFAVSKDGSQSSGWPDVQAASAIVIDADTGDILYGKDAYRRREPASTTKIVTCMLALEHLEMDQEIKVKSDGVEMGNVIGVKKGEVFTAEQLIYALMVYSANDAAVVLAEEIAGSEEEFCKMMNIKARECGAKDTNFQNPNGLNWAWHDQHYSTAYDLAVITREAMKNETFRKLVTTSEYTVPKTNKSDERRLISSNKFLWTDEIYEDVKAEAQKEDPKAKVYRPEYNGVIGVKTGMTSTAGACMVAAVDCNGKELIAVVLGSEDDQRYKELMLMWDYCIGKYYDTFTEIKAGEEVTKVRVKHGDVRKVQAIAAEDIAATLDKGADANKISTNIIKYDVKAPIKKGAVVGKVEVSYDGKVVNERELIAAEDVEKGGFLSIFGIPDRMAPFAYIAILILALTAVVIYKLKRRNGRMQDKENGEI